MLGLKTKIEKHYFVNLIVTCCVFHCYHLIGMDKVLQNCQLKFREDTISILFEDIKKYLQETLY